MNLIEELGIEKARAIVDGTPSGATDYSNEDGEIIYYQKTNNLIYWDSELGLWDEVYFSMPELKSLPDLRTAIAEHDQNLSEQRERFEKAYSLKFPESKVTLLPNGNYSGWIKQKKWKDWQAKQEQLQTELNNCSKKDSSEISITDDCTDIRNHISPLTGVIER